jgi:hypothetical protein
MTNHETRFVAAIAIVALAGVGAPAAADNDSDNDSDALHADAEVDPTAYALSGDSLHVGLGYRRFRLDLGAFALALPQWAHGDDGFDVSFEGFGAKLQYFPLAEQRGLFAGVDGGWVRLLAARQGTDLARRDDELQVGVHIGYRIALPDGFYATPWIGVSYAFSADEVALGGATYKPDRVTVFPAVHLGWRFR